MSRVILFSGKGGVGKTSSAAATGLAAARHGVKTLVMSFDLAHNLVDSMNLEPSLITRHAGKPVKVEENLEIQEIDLQEELNNQWGDTYRLVASMLYGGSMQSMLSDEAEFLPGMEDLVALHCLRDWIERGEHELIVLDCPPTAEALGFVGFGSILQYYANKRLDFDRKVSRMVRPLATRIDPSLGMFLPEDHHFEVLNKVTSRLAEMDAILRDPTRTTIRLVTNAERMVVLETKRALMYFSMYGIPIDAVLVNRLFPAESTYYSEQIKRQAEYLETIYQDFDPIPVLRVPWMQKEVQGLAALEAYASHAYGDRNPADVFVKDVPFEILKDGERAFRILIRMPFVEKEQIQLVRSGQDLGIRVGPFRRSIVLPRSLAALQTQGAKFESSNLVIRFGEAPANEEVSAGVTYS